MAFRILSHSMTVCTVMSVYSDFGTIRRLDGY
jgi:hypothetical protein